MVSWSGEVEVKNHGGFGLQRRVREVSSKGGLGKTGQRGQPPFLLKGCVGFNLVGWEKAGPKKRGGVGCSGVIRVDGWAFVLGL